MENTYKVNEEAVKKIAERVYDNGSTVINRNDLEEMFPELKESEDERIREALIEYFRWNVKQILSDFDNKEVLAWLEKQADYANFRNKIQIGDKVTRNRDGVLVNLSQLNRVAKDEKQGEQKSVVIIPKFRVGDEIKAANEESLTITKIDDKGYWSVDLFICDFDEECLWDLVEKKPAWSEEGERMLNEVILDLKLLRDNDSGEAGKAAYQREIDWLKSLRPQSQWKPSGFHLECISDAIAIYEERGINAIGLKEILEELKKLREK